MNEKASTGSHSAADLNAARDGRDGLQLAVNGGMEHPLEFTIRSARPELIDMVREYASRRLSFALRRFDGRIRRVTVRVVDQNGPKRGVDWRCSMTAELVDGREIFVEATTPWPFSSVTLASGRLREAVRRQLGRLVTHRHQPAATHGFRM